MAEVGRAKKCPDQGLGKTQLVTLREYVVMARQSEGRKGRDLTYFVFRLAGATLKQVLSFGAWSNGLNSVWQRCFTSGWLGFCY